MRRRYRRVGVASVWAGPRCGRGLAADKRENVRDFSRTTRAPTLKRPRSIRWAALTCVPELPDPEPDQRPHRSSSTDESSGGRGVGLSGPAGVVLPRAHPRVDQHHQDRHPAGGAGPPGEQEPVGARPGHHGQCECVCSCPQVHQCISDLECAEGSYCHAPTRGSAYARCQMCRRRRRRCHRDGMCCPGNHCSRSKMCLSSTIPESAISPDLDGGTSGCVSPGRVGDGCLGSGRCSAGLCCARHFWTHICKPVLQEGQVCTRRRHGGRRPLELFQRCPCAHGLGCRTLRESAGKTRLHVCQRS
uniref:Uncharacterized protein n=1 Tax=Takifugu rubripes TaxID=31033 RepID=A0A3B5K740_TAKRU